MKLTLVREHLLPEYTIGNLLIDGEYFCDVLEDTVRDLNKNGKFDNGEAKIYGKTAIPYGTYKIEFRHSPHFDRVMPYLINVPEYTGVMIHWGNIPADTLGCLLVGSNTEKGKVTQSKITFSNLWERIKNETDLTIKIV